MSSNVTNTEKIVESNPKEVEKSGVLENIRNEASVQESFEEFDLPPLRMNVAKINDRLYSSASSLQVPTNLLHQMSARKRSTFDTKTQKSRSRSCSPSLKDRATVSTAIADGNSSISSLESFDPDILYDKMGFVELEDQQRQNKQSHQNVDSLPPVFERMCDDTLDDAHAFSDFSITSINRPASSVGGSSIACDIGSCFLEPLDELDEVQEEDCDNNNEEVILINMENLNLESTEEENCEESNL